MSRRERAAQTRGELLKSLRRSLARRLLRLLGWRYAGELPDLPRYVIVAAPHTSNWDFLYLVLFMWALELRLSYLAKESLFWWPQGVILRWFGGIPVNRRTPHDLVTRLTEEFQSNEKLVLVVPPEGTRGRSTHWKSGFYRIARDAGVPVVAAALDWPSRVLTFSDPIPVTADSKSLMDTLRTFYRGAQGRHADWATPVRLENEQECSPSSPMPAPGTIDE